jgi:hexosaminidase
MRFFLMLISSLLVLITVSFTQSIIPRPAVLTSDTGYYSLDGKTTLRVAKDSPALRGIAEQCARQMKAIAGLVIPVRETPDAGTEKRTIRLRLTPRDSALGPEGYRLLVRPDSILIEAPGEAGVFYGVQSLLQLIPLERKGPAGRFPIGALTVQDRPRFPWRGMHLDVSRHFFPAKFIKTYIDMMAMHKMNMFHWHLTDDQGWRIEITKYPKLTKIGAWRVNRENRHWNARRPQRRGERATYGGFYTQREIREIVRYARERHVTIVPEIEMPAHTTAALAAYPQFSCSGGPFRVLPGGLWPITDIYCAGNDSTFSFIEDILTEVMDLFPGEYIHIGGDEADKTEWKKCPKCQARIRAEHLKDEDELQSYFIKRIEQFLRSRNRRLIGWDEILEGGLAPGSTVMSWRGMEGGIAAARQGHDVVMTPGSHCYFDYYQGKSDFEPSAIGGYLPLSKVYSFEPVPESLTTQETMHVLGAQANVWTEYIPTPKQVQYMTLPRTAAIAEVVWSPREVRDWRSFVPRVEHLMKLYRTLNLNYATSAYSVTISLQPDTLGRQVLVSLSSEMGTHSIRYSLDGEPVTSSSRIYKEPFPLKKTASVKACAFLGGSRLSAVTEQKAFIHKAVFRPVKLAYPYEKYTGGGDGGLTNGLCGTRIYDDGNWQGFHQSDLEAVVDLGEMKPVGRIATRYLENTQLWIFWPTSVEYAVSDDGTSYRTVGSFQIPPVKHHRHTRIKEVSQKLKGIHARYVKVTARNLGLCPAWHIGSGDKAWLFVDEIVVE